jgi:phenylacetate-CoA ligase
VRLGPILGRKKQMIKLRGTTLYPNSIYAVLDAIPEISDYYVVVSSDYDLSDQVKVCVALKNQATTPEMIMDKLQSRLRVRPEVIVESEQNIRQQVYAGNFRKPIRFVDAR